MVTPLFADDANWQRMDKVLRSWIGTPYKHCGRWKGRGVDCLTFIGHAWKEYGIITECRYRFYPRNISKITTQLVLEIVEEHICEFLKPEYVVQMAYDSTKDESPTLLRGDLVLINTTKRDVANHSAVFMGTERDKYLIHSLRGYGVSLAPMRRMWFERLRFIYRIFENGSS